MVMFHKKGGTQTLMDEIGNRLSSVDKLKVITGFTTKSGLEKFINRVENFENIVDYFLVGILTESSWEAFSEFHPKYRRKDIFCFGSSLISTSNNRYQPMIHAKLVIGIENDTVQWAYVGSSNVTKFALDDSNFEGGILIDNDGSNLALLNDIESYMDDIKKNHSHTFDPKSPYPRSKPTGEGEFTFIIETPFRDVGPLYLVPVLSDLEKKNFSPEKILFTSDLFVETAFASYMEKIHQPILFLFFKDFNSLFSGDYFIKLGTLTMTNDAAGGQKANVLPTMGYLNHHEKFPFISLSKRPTVLDPTKTTEVLFKIYKNLIDLEEEVKINQSSMELIKDLVSDDKSVVRRTVNNIYLKQRFFPEVRFKKKDEFVNSKYQVVEIDGQSIGLENIQTFGTECKKLFGSSNFRKIGYYLLKELVDIENTKENIDSKISTFIKERQLHSLTEFPWTIKFNKILKEDEND